MLEWRGDHGFYPVHVNGQYDEAYFKKYEGYEQTLLGSELNWFRVNWVNTHFRGRTMIDVGPGSCQFVKATNAFGVDINPATIAKLKELGRHLPEVAEVEVLTFWDSLEHLSDPALVLARARHGVAVSVPIFAGREHVLRSKHFRPDEHFWYWTHEGFLRFMRENGFIPLQWCDRETELGREDIRTYAFRRNA